MTASADAELPRLEGYQLLAEIGHGGMGSVWRARQLSTNREVAIKFLAGSAFGAAHARRRFEREVEMAARLEHPHIARVYHSGVHEGVYFYAMELIEGVHLDEHVRRQGLDESAVLALMEKACRAVDHAHHRGVIHRDLKPSNILVDFGGEPHLVDFGLARLFREAREQDQLSIGGGPLGTLAYMPPEQAAGQLDAVDTRSDVYSLGVILFQLLTGGLPYHQNGSSFEQQRRIIEDEPRRPRQVNPRLNVELEAVLLKALSRDPAQRYPGAGQLAEDLRRYLEHEPLAARPLTAGYFLRKRIRKHRGAFAIVALVVTVLLGTASYSYVQIRQERDAANRHAQAAERALYFTQVGVAERALADGDVAQAQDILARCAPAYRGWEWRHLRYQADQSMRLLSGHAAPIEAFGFDPEAQRISALGQRGWVLAWDLPAGQRVASHHFDGVAVHRALSGDGRRVAVGAGSELQVMTAADGRVLYRLDVAGRIRGVALSQMGQRLAVRTGEHLLVKDLHSGRRLLQEASVAPDTRLAFGPAGQLAWSRGRELMQVSLDTGEQRLPRTAPEPIFHLVWDATGRYLAAAGATTLVVWDISKPQPIQELTYPSWSLSALALAPGAEQLAVGQNDGSLRVFDPGRGTWRGVYHGHRGPVKGLHFLPERSQLVSASADRTLRFWQLERRQAGPTVVDLGHRDPVSALAIGSAEGTIYAGDWSGQLSAVDPETGQFHLVREQARPIQSLAGLQGGQLLLSDDQGVTLLGLTAPAAAELIHRWSGPTAAVGASEDGLWLAMAPPGPSEPLRLWKTEEPEQVREWPGVRAVALDAHGQRLASLVDDGSTLVVRRTADGHELLRRDLAHPPAQRVVFDPAGQRVAVIEQSRYLSVWDVVQGTRLYTLAPHGEGGTEDVCFSPDGQRLLTAGPSVRLWDAATGTALLTLSLPEQAPAHAVRWGLDGRFVVAGSDGRLVLWPAD